MKDLARNFASCALVLAGAISVSAAAPRAATHGPAPKASAAVAPDNDQTIRAMQDEMERSKTRLSIADVGKPFFIEYRLIDLDVKQVSATFGAEVSSNVYRGRTMMASVRVGDYHLDSSNFITEGGFQGFIGDQPGQVGIRTCGSPPTRPTKARPRKWP
jgi:hypothetical protein